jgi:hypothetical protein
MTIKLWDWDKSWKCMGIIRLLDDKKHADKVQAYKNLLATSTTLWASP